MMADSTACDGNSIVCNYEKWLQAKSGLRRTRTFAAAAIFFGGDNAVAQGKAVTGKVKNMRPQREYTGGRTGRGCPDRTGQALLMHNCRRVGGSLNTGVVHT